MSREIEFCLRVSEREFGFLFLFVTRFGSAKRSEKESSDFVGDCGGAGVVSVESA